MEEGMDEDEGEDMEEGMEEDMEEEEDEGEYTPEQFMSDLDSDRDGKVSLEELHTVVESMHAQQDDELTPEQEQEARWEMETSKTSFRLKFEAADADKDGFIDANESDVLLKMVNEDGESASEHANEGSLDEDEEEDEDEGESAKEEAEL